MRAPQGHPSPPPAWDGLRGLRVRALPKTNARVMRGCLTAMLVALAVDAALAWGLWRLV